MSDGRGGTPGGRDSTEKMASRAVSDRLFEAVRALLGALEEEFGEDFSLEVRGRGRLIALSSADGVVAPALRCAARTGCSRERNHAAACSTDEIDCPDRGARR